MPRYPLLLRLSGTRAARSVRRVWAIRSKISTANSSNGETLPPRGFGASAVKWLQRWYQQIIFISGYGDIPMTVRAMKAGAVEFLTKPSREQDLLSLMLVTALSPVIGYDKASKIAHYALKQFPAYLNSVGFPAGHRLLGHRWMLCRSRKRQSENTT